MLTPDSGCLTRGMGWGRARWDGKGLWGKPLPKTLQQPQGHLSSPGATARSSGPTAQVPLQHPWLHLCQGGNTLSSRAGPAGTSLRWTGLLSTAWDQCGWAERSWRAACMWPASSGGFLNESANGHGAEGTRSRSKSRAWGRSTTGMV